MLLIHHAVTNPRRTSTSNCTVLLPRPATVFLANGGQVCQRCTQFTDCEIQRRTRVYVLKGDDVDGRIAALLQQTPGGSLPQKPFCGRTGYPSYCAITAACNTSSATIKEVAFADWGGAPTGRCGAFHPDPKCASTAKAMAWVKTTCLGKHSCVLNPAPGGEPIKALGDPCYGSVKDLVVEMVCSQGGGSVTHCAGPPPPPAPPPSPPQTVNVRWDSPAGIGVSRTTTTLQVVTNPSRLESKKGMTDYIMLCHDYVPFAIN